MRFIEELDINNKRVLIRVDYNIPIENGEIQNDFRIKKSLQTIKYCLDRNCSIVLISHLGRPNGSYREDLSLEPISWYLEDALDCEIKFCDDCVSKEAQSMKSTLKPREILLLENLRFHNGETLNESDFSSSLASHIDIFINDAFGTAHRSHASNVGILEHVNEISYGHLMNDEIKYLKNHLNSSPSPIMFIIGGAKVSTKIKLIENVVKKSDMILVGGAMAFTFLKSMGHEVGQSLIEEDYLRTAEDIIMQASDNNVNLIFPSDVVCVKDIDNPESIEVKDINSFDVDDIGLDIGPETCINFDLFINTSKLIIWNGPLGLFENPYFSTGTQSIASSISSSGAVSVIGGGDTVSAIETISSQLNFTHISTGGGSTLELLSGNTLPALDQMELK